MTNSSYSWREFFPPHPSALVFHKHTTPEDRVRVRKGLKEAERLDVRIVTAHVADESGGKTYLVDGITRLEEMEKLGWQIVDDNGNWMPAINDMVDHHRNYSHEQVRKLVARLNGARRHMTQQDVSDAIVETLKIEVKEQPLEFLSSDAKKLSKRGRLGEGRPKDSFKTEAMKRAAEEGVNPAAVQRLLAKNKLPASKAKQHTESRRERKGKPKPKKEVPFEDQVFEEWKVFLKKFTDRQKVIEEVAGISQVAAAVKLKDAPSKKQSLDGRVQTFHDLFRMRFVGEDDKAAYLLIPHLCRETTDSYLQPKKPLPLNLNSIAQIRAKLYGEQQGGA